MGREGQASQDGWRNDGKSVGRKPVWECYLDKKGKNSDFIINLLRCKQNK